MRFAALILALWLLGVPAGVCAATLDSLKAEVDKRLAAAPADPDKAQVKQLAALKNAKKALDKSDGTLADDIAALGKADAELTGAFPGDAALSTILKGDRGILQQAILDARDDIASQVTRMKDAKKKQKAEDTLGKLNELLSTALSAPTTDAKSLLKVKKQFASLQKSIDSDRGGGTFTANIAGFADLPAYILVKKDPSDAPTADYQLFASGYAKPGGLKNSFLVYVFNPAKGTFPFKPTYARPANSTETVAYAQYYENNHFFTSSTSGSSGTITITGFDLKKQTFAATFSFSAPDEYPNDNPVIDRKSVNISGAFIEPQKGK